MADLIAVRTSITEMIARVTTPKLYLTDVDRMLERAKEATRNSKYTYIEYARYADDLVILIDAHPRHDWLMGAVEKRLREELAKLQVGSRRIRMGQLEGRGRRIIGRIYVRLRAVQRSILRE
jgi:RNA-directed DNA polymerase